MKILVNTLYALMCLCILRPAQLHAQNDEITTLLEKANKSQGKDRVERLTDRRSSIPLIL